MDESLYKAIIDERETTVNIMTPGAATFNGQSETISVACSHMRGFAQGIIDNIPQHKHLRKAHILLLVRSCKSDQKKIEKGVGLTAGKAAKADVKTKLLASIGGSALHRADFVVTISGDWTDAIGFTKEGGTDLAGAADDKVVEKVIALIDHELCHCDVKIAGEYVKDDEIKIFVEGLADRHVETCHDIHNGKGATLIRYYHTDKAARVTFKMRKHDITEFSGVIARHGAWDSRLAKMVDVMIEHQPDLFNQPKKKPAAKAKKKEKPAAA